MGKVEIIYPESREHWLQLRKANVNSSEIAALFNLSPYLTAFELHHRHVGNLPEPELDSEWVKWGNRLERPIAEGIAEDRGWNIRKKSEYRQITSERIGSSFDFQILKPVDAVFEIKNLYGPKFKSDWVVNDDGTVEASPGIELQCQHELYLAEKDRLFIGVLVGGNQAIVVERHRDEEVIQAIRSKVAEHWDRVDSRNAPQPDYRDVDALQTMFHNPELMIMQAQDNMLIRELAMEYEAARLKEKQAAEEKGTAKAQLLSLIRNDCTKVAGENFTISCGMTEATVVQAFEKKPYRNFRLTWRK